MGASKPARVVGHVFLPHPSVTPGPHTAQYSSPTRTEKQASGGPGGGNEPPGRCTDAATSSVGRRWRQPPAEPGGALAGFASSPSWPEPRGALAGFALERPRSEPPAAETGWPSSVLSLLFEPWLRSR